MNAWQPASASRIVECPTPDCAKFVAPQDLKTVQCPVCRKEFCPMCRLDRHEGVSCEDFKAWQSQNANADNHFEELMAHQQWKRCPRCGVPSERESGCNFMQCRSQTCRKNTYWCYVCGKQIPKEEHYSHYPKGPYEDLCHTPLDEHVKPGRVPANQGVGMQDAYEYGWGAVRGLLQAVGAV